MIYKFADCSLYDQNMRKKSNLRDCRNGDLIIRPNGKKYRAVGLSSDLGFMIYHAVVEDVSYGLHIVHQFWH